MKIKILAFLLFCTVSLTAQVQMQQSIPLWQKELSPAEIDDLIATYKKQYDYYEGKSKTDAKSYKVYLANNGFNLSLLYYKKNDLETSRSYLNNAIANFDGLKAMGVDISEDLAKVYFQLGQMYDAEKKFDEAIPNYEKAAASFHNAGSSSDYSFINAAAAYSNLSVIFWNQNNYAKAFPYAISAITELDQIKANYENVAIDKANKCLNAGILAQNLASANYDQAVVDKALMLLGQLNEIGEALPQNQQVQEWAAEGEKTKVALQALVQQQNAKSQPINATLDPAYVANTTTAETKNLIVDVAVDTNEVFLLEKANSTQPDTDLQQKLIDTQRELTDTKSKLTEALKKLEEAEKKIEELQGKITEE